LAELQAVSNRTAKRSSGSRMKPVIHRPKPRFEHVSIDLRRRQIRVAQHHLDRAQIRPSFEQMCRERVTHDVRAERSRDACRRAVALQYLPKADSRERPPARVDEQTRGGFPFPPRDERRTRITLIAYDPRGGLLANGDEPLLAAF